ncbi:MAG: ShlB/FhaC/HecB family hemolysin secretion/activation protein [Geminicoccaceae bacterium]|nr:MAG: ShlB/FhaC/HecB family hemolysin secretion/activation protein [Geminicoccaceae bacterium]
MSRASGGLGLGLVLTVLLVQPALAQTQPREALSPEVQRGEFDPRPLPLAEPAPAPTAPEPVPVPPPETAAFVLGGVIVEGVTALSPDDLAGLWQPLLGQPVTLQTLEALATQITAAYRSAGFVLSQAIVPAQTIGDDGIVRLQVIEGFVDRIDAQGSTPAAQAIAGRLLAAAGAERPLRLERLERGVLLARDTLGGSVETILQPSPTTFGAADLTIALEPKPAEGFAVVDNRSSRLFGPWVVRAGGSVTNTLGFGERIDLLGAAALGNPRLWYGQLGAALPLAVLDDTWLDGARLRLRGDITRADPDVQRLTPGLTSVQDEHNVGGELEVPVIRTRRENLFLSLAVNYRDSQAEARFFDDSLGVSTDRLLTFTPRLVYDRADRFGGVSLIDLRLRQGLAKDGLTKIGTTGPGAPKADFTYAAGSVQRLQRVGTTRWSVFGEVIWQLAFDTVPNSERFSLGGDAMVRGFSPGNTTGDSGYGGRIEVRRTVNLPPIQGIESGALLYGFGEWGSAIDRSDRRDGQQWEVLGSAGLGARIDVTPYLTLTPELARQIAGRPADKANNSRETRFFIGVVARF